MKNKRMESVHLYIYNKVYGEIIKYTVYAA